MLHQKKFYQKFFKNNDLKTCSRPFCVCKELSTTSVRKWHFWNKLLILHYVIANLSKLVQISMQTFSNNLSKSACRPFQITCPNQHADLFKQLVQTACRPFQTTCPNQHADLFKQLVQISMQTFSNNFLQRILWKLKRAWN